MLQYFKLDKILLILLLFSFSYSGAQDFTFSQHNNATFLYNPALTGHLAGAYRLSLMSRQQWMSIDGGFKNYSFTGDMNRFSATDNTIGFGFMATAEESMDGKLKGTNVLGSMAYHLSIDKDLKYYLSVGFQAGWYQNRYNVNNLKFESGLFGGVNEVITKPVTSSTDIRVGLNWTSYLTPKFEFKMGAAYLHVGGLQEELIEVSVTPATVVTHGDAIWRFHPKMQLLPSFLILSQGGARQFNFGTTLNRTFNEETQAFLGVHWRVNDAIIPSIGGRYKSIQLAVSYDFTISKLMGATGGSMEVSFSYLGQFARTRHVDDMDKDFFNVD